MTKLLERWQSNQICVKIEKTVILFAKSLYELFISFHENRLFKYIDNIITF